MSPYSDLDAAREIHIKFEFYFLALTFTMAAFAIQTGKFQGHRDWFLDLLEGGSWVALMFAGLIGLSRLEYFSPMYRANWNRTRESVPQAEADADLMRLENRNRTRYKLQKFAFGLGVVCLTASRILFNIWQHY